MPRQIGFDLVGMFGITGFYHHQQFRRLDRRGGEQAVMGNLDDVAAVIADTGGDVRQCARTIGDLEDQPQDPSIPEQGAQDRIGENAGVDVAA